MTICFKKYLLPILFILIIVPVSHSKVVVFDSVTTVQTPIQIRVLTREILLCGWADGGYLSG